MNVDCAKIDKRNQRRRQLYAQRKKNYEKCSHSKEQCNISQFTCDSLVNTTHDYALQITSACSSKFINAKTPEVILARTSQITHGSIAETTHDCDIQNCLPDTPAIMLPHTSQTILGHGTKHVACSDSESLPNADTPEVMLGCISQITHCSISETTFLPNANTPEVMLAHTSQTTHGSISKTTHDCDLQNTLANTPAIMLARASQTIPYHKTKHVSCSNSEFLTNDKTYANIELPDDASKKSLSKNNAEKKILLTDARNVRRRELYAKRKQTSQNNFSVGNNCHDVVGSGIDMGMLACRRKTYAAFSGLPDLLI